jgi:hypothetical protein
LGTVFHHCDFFCESVFILNVLCHYVCCVYCNIGGWCIDRAQAAHPFQSVSISATCQTTTFKHFDRKTWI